MKILLSLILISSFLFSYQTSDKLSKETISKLKIEKEKVYFISFFASWCSTCKHELPLLNEVNKNMDKTKFEFIGIDVDKDETKGIKFQKEKEVKFRVINDSKSKIIKSFNPVGIPAIYIIKDNKVSNVFIGAVKDIDKKLKEYINE